MTAPATAWAAPNAGMRYPVKRFGRFSQDASDYLDAMAQRRGTKPGTIIRRAVMKEIYTLITIQL
jgi:hypothetical protein